MAETNDRRARLARIMSNYEDDDKPSDSIGVQSSISASQSGGALPLSDPEATSMRAKVRNALDRESSNTLSRYTSSQRLVATGEPLPSSAPAMDSSGSVLKRQQNLGGPPVVAGAFSTAGNKNQNKAGPVDALSSSSSSSFGFPTQITSPSAVAVTAADIRPTGIASANSPDFRHHSAPKTIGISDASPYIRFLQQPEAASTTGDVSISTSASRMHGGRTQSAKAAPSVESSNSDSHKNSNMRTELFKGESSPVNRNGRIQSSRIAKHRLDLFKPPPLMGTEEDAVDLLLVDEKPKPLPSFAARFPLPEQTPQMKRLSSASRRMRADASADPANEVEDSGLRHSSPQKEREKDRPLLTAQMSVQDLHANGVHAVLSVSEQRILSVIRWVIVILFLGLMILFLTMGVIYAYFVCPIDCLWSELVKAADLG